MRAKPQWAEEWGEGTVVGVKQGEGQRESGNMEKARGETS